jgi:hypothetical protein
MAGFDVSTFPGNLTYAKLSALLADAGYVMPAFEQDSGDGVGVSLRRIPMVSAARRLAVGLSTKLFDYQFSAGTQNTALWRHLFTTMTMTQGSGTLLMNANSTLTTTTGCLLSTWRQLNFPGNGTVQVEIEILFTEQPLANQMVIVGAFPHVSATALPTDGVYFKYSSAGLIGIVNFNGTETPTGVLLTPADFTNNKMYTLRLDVSNSGVDFYRDDRRLGSIAPANANGEPMLFAALPIALQFYNPGTVSGSPVMQAKVANVSVTQRDMATMKSWEVQQTTSGLVASQGSEGGTMGSTALYTNSLAPGAGAAMTNTTAALGSGFGGQFTALPTLAANTDGILQSYQNPVGSATQPPRTILIKGVWIKGMVTTALTGGPVYYFYSLAYGHTAVSMATAETGSFVTATAKAPRRIPLGIETFVVTAAVGTLGQGLYVPFTVPIAVNPGEFVAVCAKNVGTVTTLGAIAFLVGFDAMYE